MYEQVETINLPRPHVERMYDLLCRVYAKFRSRPLKQALDYLGRALEKTDHLHA